MLTFSPFIGHDSVETLDRRDIEDLVGRTAEGYVIEFKRQMPANEKIARSLASFANTVGGWYIVGIEAGGDNVACAIPGIPAAESAAAISRVRDVASSRIQPTPVFESCVIDMGSERVVLLVHVPGDQDVPFICDDGRVYRRNGETSEPFAEKDRRSFDELLARGRSSVSRLAEFVSRSRSSSIIGETPRVELFLAPYPPGIAADWDALTEESVERVKTSLQRQSLHLREGDAPAFFMNMTSVEASVRWRSNSVILRLAGPTDPFAEVLEVEWTPGFFFRFDAPLRMLGSLGHGGMLGGLDLPVLGARTSEALRVIRAVGSEAYDHDHLNRLQLLDGRELMLQFAVFFETFRQVVGERLWTGKALRAVRGSGLANGLAVLVDCDEWAAHVQRYGLPLADFPAEVVADRILVTEVERHSWLSAAGIAGLHLGLGQETTAKVFSECLISAGMGDST